MLELYVEHYIIGAEEEAPATNVTYGLHVHIG